MNTLLADPPAAPPTEQPSASGPPETSDPAGQPSPRGHMCAQCGAPLEEDQQWCLQCGACEPRSLGERSNWRPLTVLTLLAAILAAGAAVAAAAALNQHSAARRPATVALVPAATPTAPTSTTPGLPATTPGAGGAAKTGGKAGSSSQGSPNNLLFPPSSPGKPPKVTSPTATPKSTGGSNPTGESTGPSGESTTTTPAKTKTTETGTSTTGSKSNGESNQSEHPNPILLDTNAAATYNPYSYPEAGFGDPALAIDGEPSTAWTAQIQAHSFPNMAEGLLVDLRSPTKLGSMELRTPTRGMTIQVYGANGDKAPATITAPGWTQLRSSHVLKKTVTHLKLRTEGQAFRWLLVWIVKAPAAAQGTAQAPGHVALSEVALYPPAA